MEKSASRKIKLLWSAFPASSIKLSIYNVADEKLEATQPDSINPDMLHVKFH